MDIYEPCGACQEQGEASESLDMISKLLSTSLNETKSDTTDACQVKRRTEAQQISFYLSVITPQAILGESIERSPECSPEEASPVRQGYSINLARATSRTPKIISHY